jgi:hypothetical protein
MLKVKSVVRKTKDKKICTQNYDLRIGHDLKDEHSSLGTTRSKTASRSSDVICTVAV